MSMRIVFASFILLLSVDLIAAPQKYVWYHPWFNKDMSSDQPPPWPYEVIEERNGVTRVKVTPPNSVKPAPQSVAPAPKTESPPPPQIKPTTSPEPERKKSISESASPKIRDACKKLGPFAIAVASVRQKGVPLHTAETGVEGLLGRQTTSDGLEFAKSIVRSVYANKLTTENAEEIIVGSCEIMAFVADMEKSRK